MQLFQGDCLELMPLLIPQSIDLILCDLPYGTTNCSWDQVIPFADLWPHYKRLLRPGGAVILFGCQPFTSVMVLSNLPWYKQALVGDKNNCGSPALAKIRPMQVHEDIVIFAPGRTVYNPQMEKGEPYSRRTANPEGYVGKHNRHGYGMKPRTEFSNEGTRYPKSIIDMHRDFSAQQQIHSAQKPVHTCRWLIETYSNPGATVLDNCFGSGSTGIACFQTGRSFIGIEKDPVEYEKGRERIIARQISEFDEL